MLDGGINSIPIAFKNNVRIIIKKCILYISISQIYSVTTR